MDIICYFCIQTEMMINKDIKVIAIDIDGTLLNSKKELTERTRLTLKQAQEEGQIVVLATGRPTCGVTTFANKLELHKYGGYILSYNGGSIVECKSGEPLFSSTLNPSFIAELYKDASSCGATILSYEGECVITENPECRYVEIEARVNNIPIKKVDNFVDAITFPIVKCLAVGDPELMVQLEIDMKEKYGNTLSIFRSEPFFIEIVSPKIDKGESLDRLMVHLGLTKENLIAFGDGFNDLTMLEYAGVGVAMANAQDVLKGIADIVTLSNEEDGVADVVDKFILSK